MIRIRSWMAEGGVSVFLLINSEPLLSFQFTRCLLFEQMRTTARRIPATTTRSVSNDRGFARYSLHLAVSCCCVASYSAHLRFCSSRAPISLSRVAPRCVRGFTWRFVASRARVSACCIACLVNRARNSKIAAPLRFLRRPSQSHRRQRVEQLHLQLHRP